MLSETIEHLKGESSLESVYFVLFDARARDVFQSTWDDLRKQLSTGAASA